MLKRELISTGCAKLNTIFLIFKTTLSLHKSSCKQIYINETQTYHLKKIRKHINAYIGQTRCFSRMPRRKLAKTSSWRHNKIDHFFYSLVVMLYGGFSVLVVFNITCIEPSMCFRKFTFCTRLAIKRSYCPKTFKRFDIDLRVLSILSWVRFFFIVFLVFLLVLVWVVFFCLFLCVCVLFCVFFRGSPCIKNQTWVENC